MPRDGVHILDDIKLAVFEATDELRQDNERLRLAISASTDAAARATEAAGRARAEAGRAAAALVERERDLELVSEGMRGRVERLGSELEAAGVRAEVLAAKGQMYDELRSKLEGVVDENRRLQVWMVGVQMGDHSNASCHVIDSFRLICWAACTKRSHLDACWGNFTQGGGLPGAACPFIIHLHHCSHRQWAPSHEMLWPLTGPALNQTSGVKGRAAEPGGAGSDLMWLTLRTLHSLQS